jgi:hypothetical protein
MPNCDRRRVTNPVRTNAGTDKIARPIPKPGAIIKTAKQTAISVVVNRTLAIVNVKARFCGG